MRDQGPACVGAGHKAFKGLPEESGDWRRQDKNRTWDQLTTPDYTGWFMKTWGLRNVDAHNEIDMGVV